MKKGNITLSRDREQPWSGDPIPIRGYNCNRQYPRFGHGSFLCAAKRQSLRCSGSRIWAMQNSWVQDTTITYHDVTSVATGRSNDQYYINWMPLTETRGTGISGCFAWRTPQSPGGSAPAGSAPAGGLAHTGCLTYTALGIGESVPKDVCPIRKRMSQTSCRACVTQAYEPNIPPSLRISEFAAIQFI